MSFIKIVLLSMALVLVISSCQDSLGINGADYTKSQLNDQIITRDTMINFKKATIEIIITKTDTIINYIPVNRVYEPVYSNRSEFTMLEQFEDISGDMTSNRINEKYDSKIISYLDYNPMTPEVNFKMTINNPNNSNLPEFKERTEVIKSLDIEFKKLSVLHDYPLSLKEFLEENSIKFELVMINRIGVTRRINQEEIFGSIEIGNRFIGDGQIRGLGISGELRIPANNFGDLKRFAILFETFLLFPSI